MKKILLIAISMTAASIGLHQPGWAVIQTTHPLLCPELLNFPQNEQQEIKYAKHVVSQLGPQFLTEEGIASVFSHLDELLKLKGVRFKHLANEPTLILSMLKKDEHRGQAGLFVLQVLQEAMETNGQGFSTCNAKSAQNFLSGFSLKERDKPELQSETARLLIKLISQERWPPLDPQARAAFDLGPAKDNSPPLDIKTVVGRFQQLGLSAFGSDPLIWNATLRSYEHGPGLGGFPRLTCPDKTGPG